MMDGRMIMRGSVQCSANGHKLNFASCGIRTRDLVIQSQNFDCVEVLRSSQPIRVMLNIVSLPKQTFPGQAYPLKWLTSTYAHFSPETDNSPS